MQNTLFIALSWNDVQVRPDMLMTTKNPIRTRRRSTDSQDQPGQLQTARPSVEPGSLRFKRFISHVQLVAAVWFVLYVFFCKS